MAIIHDAYLFNPDAFAATIAPYAVGALQGMDGYQSLREHALRVYDESPHVQELARRYGGWDRDAILTQIRPDGSDDPEDTAFWLAILLYAHLGQSEGETLGLGEGWRVLADALVSFGWSRRKSDLLIRGHSFVELPRGWSAEGAIPNSDRLVGALGHIGGLFPSGSAGWLDIGEVRQLVAKLVGDGAKVPPSDAHIRSDGAKAYQAARGMLAVAAGEGRGLCMILSG